MQRQREPIGETKRCGSGMVYLLSGLGLVEPVLNAVFLFLAGFIGIYLTLAILSKRPLPIR